MAPHPTRLQRAPRHRLPPALLAAAALVGGLAVPAAASGSPARRTLALVPARGLGARLGPSRERTIRLDVVLASPSAARPVAAWLRDAGVRARPRGGALELRADTAVVGRLFGVRFFDYARAGQTVYASTRPSVPAALAGDVRTVIGLNDAPVPIAALGVDPRPLPLAPAGAALGPASASAVPAACPAVAAAAVGDATMTQLSERYGIAALLDSGDAGGGETIATVELAASSATDIAAYDACFGLSPAAVSSVAVDGGGASGAGTTEADLDLEQLQTQAPGARIVSYEAPDTFSGWYDALAAAVGADPGVISLSWGMCEASALPPSTGADMLAPIDALLARARAQGETVIAAAGDRGAEDCASTGGGAAQTSLAVDFPASDPNVTAVGATALGPGGAEEVWNASAGAGVGGASGGGVSQEYAEPPWQSTIAGALSGPCPTGQCRGVPDLAVDANAVVFFANGAWEVGSGTSFAAPLVAGMAADVAGTCATPIGDLAPRLYAWAALHAGALTPVLAGENDYTGAFGGDRYLAGAPYSLAGGLGTPDASLLSCPVVQTVSALSAPAGTTLTLSGENLATASVAFAATPATVLAADATSLRVVVPPGAGATTITVSNPTGAARPVAFTYGPHVAAGAPAPAASGAGGPQQPTWSPAGTARAVLRDPRPVLGTRLDPAWVLGARTETRIGCTADCAGTAQLRVGPGLAGQARFAFSAAGSHAVVIPLSVPTRRRLAVAPGHRLLAMLVVDLDGGASARRSVVLREAPVLSSTVGAIRHGGVVRAGLVCSLACGGLATVRAGATELGAVRFSLAGGAPGAVSVPCRAVGPSAPPLVEVVTIAGGSHLRLAVPAATPLSARPRGR